ncbi:Formate/nitrite transporter FocA, FNT family [Litoreibacter ascidiaceicola]|uniref:Formate/nitrite transporter FocA, FNT family n=1 Tax=Litoreibacter ascidiaceicola TaxID=1486859 RepID=A0A1M4TTT0_9RHOB|nr:formate/nitrite transporter family protein [Litoreibacter ascidiaceicola]SHE47899.1 Formate/nitrite transporter FocA, FNT family [Litoreibacter ascidiaceicola]
MTPKSRKERDKEDRSIESAKSLGAKLIFEVIRREGDEELERPIRSLIWSGVAAGIMISLSVLGEAIFRTYLPDTPWRPLLENLGYSLGFLVVILGGMQLFTENTITTVLPLMSRPGLRMLGRVARLWTVVLIANVAGAFAIAILYAHTPALPSELMPAMMELSHHATGMPAGQSFFRAIPAGVIVAAIVWMLPNSEGFGFWVILTFTWLIAAGDFTHVVAGSVEMALLMVTGQLALWPALSGFFIPVLAGNVVGGTVIFALITYGQVRHELKH